MLCLSIFGLCDYDKNALWEGMINDAQTSGLIGETQGHHRD